MTMITKAMRKYLENARDLGGIVATNWVQRQMQFRMRDAGLIERNRLGYYEPTAAGLYAAGLQNNLATGGEQEIA